MSILVFCPFKATGLSAPLQAPDVPIAKITIPNRHQHHHQPRPPPHFCPRMLIFRVNAFSQTHIQPKQTTGTRPIEFFSDAGEAFFYFPDTRVHPQGKHTRLHDRLPTTFLSDASGATMRAISIFPSLLSSVRNKYTTACMRTFEALIWTKSNVVEISRWRPVGLFAVGRVCGRSAFSRLRVVLSLNKQHRQTAR